MDLTTERTNKLFKNCDFENLRVKLQDINKLIYNLEEINATNTLIYQNLKEYQTLIFVEYNYRQPNYLFLDIENIKINVINNRAIYNENNEKFNEINKSYEIIKYNLFNNEEKITL